MPKLFFNTDFRGRPPKPMLRGKIYYIRYRAFGKDIWRSLHTSDKREAEYLAVEIWRNWQTEKVQEMIPAPPRGLDLVWTRYTETESFAQLSELTRNSKRVQWEAFAKWCRERKVKYAHQLTKEACVEYLTRNNQKNKTFNNILGDLKLVLAYGGAEKNPFDAIERRSTKRTTAEKASTSFNLITDAETEKLLAYIKTSNMTHREEWHDAALLSSKTALRYKDIALLRFDSVKYDGRGAYLELVPEKTKAKTGGKSVYIRLVQVASDLLETRRMTTAGDYVFPALQAEYSKTDKNGKPLGSQATKPFLKICSRLGINASFHSFRVSVITKAAKAGIDLESFGGVVGHSTSGQTEAYNRAALEIDLSDILKTEL